VQREAEAPRIGPSFSASLGASVRRECFPHDRGATDRYLANWGIGQDLAVDELDPLQHVMEHDLTREPLPVDLVADGLVLFDP